MEFDKGKLIYRLKFYGIGFGLGCVVVWATLYRGRDDRPAWLPEGRVIQFLKSTDILINDKLKCELQCNNIPENFMDSTFWANAVVDFEQSATKRKPCPEHYIKSTIKDEREIAVYVENCEYCEDCKEEGVATLRSFVNLSEKDKDCSACK